MKPFKFAVYVGPTAVHQVSEAFRKAGCISVFEGTMHIYWKFLGADVEDAKQRTLHALWNSAESRFGININDIRLTANQEQWKMTTELKLQFLEEKLGKDKVNHLLAILKTILPYFTEADCINRLYLEEFKER